MKTNKPKKYVPMGKPAWAEQSDKDELRKQLADTFKGYFFAKNRSTESAVDDVIALFDTYCKQQVEKAEQSLIAKLATPEFVYEVMNAPTNGAAVDMIRAELNHEKEL